MGRFKEKAKGWLRRAKGREGLGAATVIIVVVLLVILNVIVTALSAKYSWYVYTAPRYEHQIGDASDSFFSDLDQGRELKIRFCMAREELEGDSAYSLVLETARQFAEKYDFISVDFINIFVDPGEVKRYKYGAAHMDDDPKDRVKINDVSEASVIFDAGYDEGSDDFSVTTLRSFFILDGDQYVTGYDGERVMSALIHRTMADERPVACFTIGHGETSSELLYNILVCAGYSIATVDLAKDEIPEGTSLLVVSNPLYDFEMGAEGSGIVSEIERLDAFSADGGTVFAILDPLVTELPHLNAYLADWGLSRREGTVRDMINSLTSDGYAISTSFASSKPGRAIRDRIREFSDANVVLKRAAAIDVAAPEGVDAYPVLTVGGTATISADGKTTDRAGGYAVAAYAEKAVGADKSAGLFLVSSVYMTSSDAIRTNGYANADFIYAILEYADEARVPLGTKVMLIENEKLEGVTRGVIRLTLAILFAVIPAAVVTVGVVVRIKRKNR